MRITRKFRGLPLILVGSEERGAPLACLEELARWNKCYNITLLKPHFYKLEVK